MVQIDSRSIQDAIKKIEKEYGYVSDNHLKTATARALTRSAQSGRTLSRREISAKFAISGSVIDKMLKSTRATTGTMEAQIIASGRPLSLNYFGAKQEKFNSFTAGGGSKTIDGRTSFNAKGVASSRLIRRVNKEAKRGVTLKIKRGGEELNLPTAFIQVANGGITVFARGRGKGRSQGFEFGKKRMPIDKLTTLSVPMMFVNNDVLGQISTRVIGVLNTRIEAEIKYLLKK